MKKILLLSLLFLVGCEQYEGLTNEEIVKQTKFCEENGLEARALTSVYGPISLIQCVPK